MEIPMEIPMDTQTSAVGNDALNSRAEDAMASEVEEAAAAAAAVEGGLAGDGGLLGENANGGLKMRVGVRDGEQGVAKKVKVGQRQLLQTVLFFCLGFRMLSCFVSAFSDVVSPPFSAA